MNDKTAIEKAARKVIESWDKRSCGEQEVQKELMGTKFWSPSASMVDSSAIHELREAIAALDAEKPGEDWRTLCDVRSDMMRDCAIGQYQDADDRLLRFAASYHADKCKVCNDFCARAKEHCEDREAPLV